MSQKVGIVCGLAAIISFVALYSIAMSLDSGYVFGKNYLSDLGVSDGAWAFNAGVIIAGALFIPFAVFGLSPVLGNGRSPIVCTLLMAIAGLFLISIGIFTEDAGDIHGVVSYGFFLTMLVTLGVVAYSLCRSNSLGRFGYLVTLMVFMFGLAMLPVGGNPLSETLAVLSILLWGLLIGIALLVLDKDG
ncbi:MAG: DUF998 domain-containing protein [Candidatus Thermoplasmatota archaeon]|nr:DUF998 domain-containing protein [Candidatus Thermoplasmatota archaeon]MBU1915373.1 DUF998 domain-containing protein [Candidatus Thermoplasmatota archaeon]